MRQLLFKLIGVAVATAGSAAVAVSLQDSLPGCCQIREIKPKGIKLGESPKAIANRLFRDGPGEAIPADRRLDSVQGFVRNHWPVVVDFEPQLGTRTELRISLYERHRILNPRTVRFVMDPDGRGGRQLFEGIIEMPIGVWRRPVGIARFEVISRRLNASTEGTVGRVRVEVYGIGAGPRAVGSISVTDVVFAPPARRLRLPPRGGIRITYGYQLKQPFDLVVEDIWRTCETILCKPWVLSNRVLGKNGPQSRKYLLTKAGKYRLNVRAWLICPNADFTACADSAAWAIGRSPPVVVER